MYQISVRTIYYKGRGGHTLGYVLGGDDKPMQFKTYDMALTYLNSVCQVVQKYRDCTYKEAVIGADLYTCRHFTIQAVGEVKDCKKKFAVVDRYSDRLCVRAAGVSVLDVHLQAYGDYVIQTGDTISFQYFLDKLFDDYYRIVDITEEAYAYRYSKAPDRAGKHLELVIDCVVLADGDLKE